VRRLLICTATDLTATDHRRPSVSVASPEALASIIDLACMHCPAKKKPRVLSDLNRMVAYRFGQPGLGQATGFGPAWLRSAASARSNFFQKIQFDVFVNPCKFENSIKIILCIQID
jgi:hypothetical protein